MIRLAGFHGTDDPVYKYRCGATVWSVDAPCVSGFGAGKAPHFSADEVFGAASALPVEDAALFEFTSAAPREGPRPTGEIGASGPRGIFLTRPAPALM